MDERRNHGDLVPVKRKLPAEFGKVKGDTFGSCVVPERDYGVASAKVNRKSSGHKES